MRKTLGMDVTKVPDPIETKGRQAGNGKLVSAHVNNEELRYSLLI
jgi:hypothetical protein